MVAGAKMGEPTAGEDPERGTEEALVARFRSGDSRAFDELVDIHMDRVFAVAVELLGSRQDAEDVTQEVLIKLYHHLPRLRMPGRLRPWLYRVCVNQCIDRRRSSRRQPLELDSSNFADCWPATDPATSVVAAALRQSVRAALAELPDQQRMAFTLRHFAGLSISEIAEMLRCAPATVRVHLSRATHRLREALSEEVSTDESL